MSKAVLHNLIDMLDDTDTETIYRVLIKFIPEVEPSEDEIKSFAAAELEIQNGDVSDFDNVDWN